MDAEASPSPPPISRRPMTLTDLDADSLSRCASFLSLADVSNLAVTCSTLRRAAYSDAVWSRLFREQWPSPCLPPRPESVREIYLDRYINVNQFKFLDPIEVTWSMYPLPYSQILLKKNEAFLAQGSTVQKVRLESPKAAICHDNNLIGHKARITSMRLFSLNQTSLFRNTIKNEENFLVTSSSDRTIRIWWKGCSYRCLKGHNGPVTSLADTLLGNCGAEMLASGGEDCTVRLWSIGGKQSKHHPLMVTFHGHEKPVSSLSVAQHKTSLLVSMSTDSKIRVWDTASPSSTGSSSCVGMVGFPGMPVGMKCHDTLCYIAAGSTVMAIDIRTMRRVSTAAVHPPKIRSFEMLSSEWLVCTGGEDKALVWDIRKNQVKPEPVAELDHGSRVTMLHMDPCKIVTGGPLDYHANVWETRTGSLTNHLDCRDPDDTDEDASLLNMGVDGSLIATSTDPGVVHFRDYSNSSVPLCSPADSSTSKFWEPLHCSDDDDNELSADFGRLLI